MPKTITKFTAQFTTKLGKTPVEISIPIDLADATSEEISSLLESVSHQAQDRLQDLVNDAKFKFKNQADLKKAHKAAVKAAEKASAPEA